MPPIRVLVVDDHEIVRAGLQSLLGREEDIHVVGMAPNAEEGLRLVDELHPEVAVVDYSLPGMSGVELCERILQDHADVKVVMLTTYLDDHVVRRSLEAGAKAYVYKDVEGVGLKRAIRRVAQGEAVLDPKVAGRVMKWSQRRRTLADGNALSSREVDVLRLAARGLTNREIAEELVLSINTIKTLMRRVFTKLGCRSRSEAAAIATREGML